MAILLVFLWDLKARAGLAKFKKIEDNSYSVTTIPPLAIDPLIQYISFFYTTVFARESDYKRTQRLLLKNDATKMRSG